VTSVKTATGRVLDAPPAPERYTAHLPEGLAPLDVDVIKLAAMFAARNGRQLVDALARREAHNPLFYFLRPAHSLHGLFSRLADAYSAVLAPGKDVKVQLEMDADDGALPSLLERCLHRLEWEREADRRRREEDDERERERRAVLAIDWHDFAVVETIAFADEEDEALPAVATLRDVVEMNRRAADGAAVAAAAASAGDGDGGGADAADAAAAEAAAAFAVEGMDEEERALVAEGAGAAAAARGRVPPPTMPPPPPVVSAAPDVDEGLAALGEEEEEEERAAAPAPAAASPKDGDDDDDDDDDDDEAPIRVVKDYVRRRPAAAAAAGAGAAAGAASAAAPAASAAAAAAAATAYTSAGVAYDPSRFVVSPITGELVALADMAEHMRVSLIDPRYKGQREAMLGKVRNSAKASDAEISRNLVALARTRPDVFGEGGGGGAGAGAAGGRVTGATAYPPDSRVSAGPAAAPARGGTGALPPPPPGRARLAPPPPPPAGGPRKRSAAAAFAAVPEDEFLSLHGGGAEPCSVRVRRLAAGGGNGGGVAGEVFEVAAPGGIAGTTIGQVRAAAAERAGVPAARVELRREEDCAAGAAADPLSLLGDGGGDDVSLAACNVAPGALLVLSVRAAPV